MQALEHFNTSDPKVLLPNKNKIITMILIISNGSAYFILEISQFRGVGGGKLGYAAPKRTKA